ncbi:hypothetical protein AUP68_03078 [Ilyonectria robusta]
METAIRHSLLSKTKHFREKLPPRMESNSTKLISETDRTAVDVDADDYAPAVRVEEDDDDIGLADIPAVDTVRRSRFPSRQSIMVHDSRLHHPQQPPRRGRLSAL